MNNDDISHFSTIPASFAIKSNVYFITHQYLIINNSQSQRALSVSVRTVLWIYFASRRNCGLLPCNMQMISMSEASAIDGRNQYQIITCILNDQDLDDIFICYSAHTGRPK